MQKRILHVEDNPDDVALTAMAFDRARVPVKIEPVADADQAMDMLEAGLRNCCLPSCVLLDIKLPGRSGLEVLAWIRSHPELRRLPVIMLTSSGLEQDIDQAYDLGANAFLLKPPDLESLTDLVRAIGSFWLTLNRGPSLQSRASPRRLAVEPASGANPHPSPWVLTHGA